MKKFTLTPFTKAARAGILLASLVPLATDAYSQTWERVYANGQTNNNADLLVTIGDATQAVGSDLDDYSTLDFILTGSAWQRFTFAETPGTNPIHVKIGKDAGVLSALTTITIEALDGDGDAVATESIGGLLSLLNGEDELDVVLEPATSASSVRVTYSGIALGSPLRVFAAYFDQAAATDISCNNALDILSGSTGGLATALTAVDDVDDAADGDETTFATMNALASVANTTHITTLYGSASKAGDSVRIVLADPAGLLDVGLISSRLSVTTFDGNTATTLLDGGALLSLRLLPGSTDIQELVIATTVPFDRIQVAIGGVATVLTDLNVYEIGKVIPAPGVVIDTVKIYEGVGALPTLTAVAEDEDDEVEWYASSTPSGDPLYTGSSYTLTTSPAASQSFYAFTSRNGCVETSAPSEIHVLVRPVTIDVPEDEDAEFTPGEPYEYTIAVSVGEDGGVPDFTYYLPEDDPHLAGGMGTMAVGLPPGLTLATNGTLSGTPDPTAELEFTFDINVYDALDNPVVISAPVTLVNAAPLPVTFVSFTAKAIQSNTAQLNWKTASEKNNSHFEIERSADARNFTKVGRIEGNGTTTESHSYVFSDQVQDGTAVAYYRIRQVDFDGKSAVTEIRKVEFGKANATVVTVYPNPSDSKINIEANNQAVAAISVYDMTGRQIAIINQVAQNNQLTLSPGLYMVNAMDASGNLLSTTKVTIR